MVKKIGNKFKELIFYFKNIDKILLLSILLFAAFGLVVVFSASNITAVLFYHYESTYFFIRQLLFTILGLGGLFFFSLILNERRYFFWSIVALLILFVLFISLRTMGSINNSQSWYSFNGATFQPSEFAKTAIIVFLAGWYNSFKNYEKWWGIFVPCGIVAVFCLFIALEPDLGTAAVITLITMLIFFSLPVKDNKIVILKYVCVLVAVLGLAYVYLRQDYFINKEASSRQESRLAFTKPCSRSLNNGYQVCNAYIAINNGGLFGRGFGQSTQKFLYLPEAYTDFVFPIVVEEIGVIGAIGVLVAYGFLLFKILSIARHATNLQDSIVAFGTFAYILIHILVNLLGVLALIPMTGIPLPFLSYGGSFLLNLFVLLGMTLRVSANNKRYRKG